MGTLRDELSKVTDEIIARDTPETPAETPSVQAPAEAAPATETAPVEDKPGRTAGRARDEKGRLLPGSAKDTAAASSPATPIREPEQVASTVAAEPKKVARPSSWKKDHWEAFDQLASTNPALAEYINQREGEFAKGVSTYKNEFERAKPLLEATQELVQRGIDPASQVSRYMQIHKSLAMGTPEQKLSTFLQIAQDYQVPVQHLFVRGQDGQVYFNQQYQQAQQQQQAPQQPDVNALLDQKLNERDAMRQVEQMKSDKAYPHFEEVKATMVGLLQAGLADDYPSAYQAALRHPRHSELFDAIQKQEREQEASRKAEEARKTADVARRNAVSPRTATPAGTSTTAKKGSVRDVIESAVEAHTAGRV